MLQIFKSILLTALFMFYPYLVYHWMQSGMVWIPPALFAAIYLKQSIQARTTSIKCYKASLAIVLLLGAYYVQTLTAKVLPVLIQLMLMYFFGRTLLKNRGPSFIERFVRLEFPDFPPGVSEYCRQLTWMWTLFFAFNAFTCTLLAMMGNDYGWALFNGIIIYVMIGVLMIGEYIYRHFRFPDLGIPDPKSTIKTMIVNGRKVWMDMEKR
jgi:uncharacterized membrane protein